MLPGTEGGIEAVRFSTPDALEEYVAAKPLKTTSVSRSEALEETFFLGLRLNCGVDLREVSAKFGENAVENNSEVASDCVRAGLLERRADSICLTPRGRLLSNEVFERFISVPARAI
jgi:oxygen-independent coproporphyrinogen-3 oxidase